MDKEQAEYLGLPVHPSKHDMHKRAPWHDYHKKGLYMLTIVVKDRWQILGNLVADPDPRVDLLPLGEAILRGEIHKIQGTYPMVEVWRTCIMPDHIHMIVRVNEDMPPKKHLGDVVRGFKAGCNQAYRRIYGLDGGTMFERVITTACSKRAVSSTGGKRTSRTILTVCGSSVSIPICL